MGDEPSVNNYGANMRIQGSNANALNSESDRSTYFKNISLSYFADNPLEMLTNHQQLKELCLHYHNPEAHYIEGILQYFVHSHRNKGLFHLRQSAVGNYSAGTYLYGLIMLALERYEKGQKYLDKLHWKTNISTSDTCWETVKRSLSDIPGIMEYGYYIAMVNLEPRNESHPNNQYQVCKHPYYYQRLSQFVEFARNHSTIMF